MTKIEIIFNGKRLYGLSEVLVYLDEQRERISELEKENVELKTEKIPRLERKIASIRGAHSVDCKKLNARIEQVERLKKENADLEAQIERMKCCCKWEIKENDNTRIIRRNEKEQSKVFTILFCLE